MLNPLMNLFIQARILRLTHASPSVVVVHGFTYGISGAGVVCNRFSRFSHHVHSAEEREDELNSTQKQELAENQAANPDPLG